MELAASPADYEVRVLVFLHMSELAGETAELPATVVTEEELLPGVLGPHMADKDTGTLLASSEGAGGDGAGLAAAGPAGPVPGLGMAAVGCSC